MGAGRGRADGAGRRGRQKQHDRAARTGQGRAETGRERQYARDHDQSGRIRQLDVARSLLRDRTLEGARDRADDHGLRPEPRLRMDGERSRRRGGRRGRNGPDAVVHPPGDGRLHGFADRRRRHRHGEVPQYPPALLNDKGLRFGPNDTYASALQSVGQGIGGKGYSELNQGVNLGSFGGFIVFGFDHTVMNVKGLRDFRIGSPLSKTGYPGQGVVYVSFDANGNGKADDQWYEIAGSEYGKTSERRDLKIVYTRPADLAPSEATDGWAAYTINGSETGAYCYAKAMWGTVASYWPEWLKVSAEGTGPPRPPAGTTTDMPATAIPRMRPARRSTSAGPATSRGTRSICRASTS